MEMLRIATDNPKEDQWKLIGQYAYPTNINRYAKVHKLSPSVETVNYIAGCIRQSEAYFTAAEAAPLDISPLLLYYGATNLLAGVSALLTGTKSLIEHHGMYADKTTVAAPMLGGFQIKTSNSSGGALQSFCDVLSTGCVMTTGGLWSVKEILGSIPDLSQDYETCYEEPPPHVIPVVILKAAMHGIRFTHERIAMSDLEKYASPQAVIELIGGLKDGYITPRYNIPSDSVPLYYKQEAKETGTYSIFGKKYLQLVHVKAGKRLDPSQLILLYMGLYALGYLSRYYPERWNPFVRSDDTGERLVVEKFLAICQRYLPNLALNQIRKARVQFIYETERVVDLTGPDSDT